MKTVLLCRDGLAARYLAHELAAGGAIDGIVVEEGRAARRRKLRRAWRRTAWWRLPVLALDLTALAIYGVLWNRALRRRLRGHPARAGYPEGPPLRRVDDANDENAIRHLASLAPEALLVFGTAILETPVLAIPSRAALNVHGGIVPAYRNVHSDVWAVLRGDVGSAGTSILYLDEGIDSGDVALQQRVEGAKGFFDLRWRNLELSVALAAEALRALEAGTLPRVAQEGGEAGFYPSPGAADLVRLLFTRVG